MFSSMNQITDKIYLGDLDSASNVKNLKSKNITRVISLTGFLSPQYAPQDKIEQKVFDLFDISTSNIYRFFRESIKFIDECKGNVLVHCAAGFSRSPTIVIAYIMWKEKMGYETAFNFVRSKRLVGPNPGFVKQLIIFENNLKKTNYNLEDKAFDNSQELDMMIKGF